MKRLAIAALVGLVTSSSPASADRAAADQLVVEAEAKAATGDLVGAAAKFREAYVADPRPELLCNVAVAYHKAGTELSRAQLFLSRCLERGTTLEPQFVEAIRAALAEVETQLRTGNFTPLDLILTPPSTGVTISVFAADEIVLGSRVVWLPYGSYTLVFTADSYVTKEVTVVASGHDRAVVQVTLERAVAPPPPPIRYGTSPSKLPAVGATAVTIGALLVAAVSFTKAHDRADLAAFARTDAIYMADETYVDSWNTRLAISGIVAIVGAGASGLLWANALRARPVVEVGPQSTTLSLLTWW